MMRDAINEKNVDFQKNFRQQKDLVMAQVIRLVCTVINVNLFCFIVIAYYFYHFLSSKRKQ
jgi:hypothetical protein